MINEKVAALVILYNFDTSAVDNIRTYSDQVKKVYAYDNSEIKNEEAIRLLMEIPNLEYLGGCGNEGLSVPINVVAEKAIHENITWLVTFDQDSRATENMITIMYEFVENHNKKSEIGLIGPTVYDGKTEFALPAINYSYYDKIIQSGAMHNLEVWKQVGGYDPKLFIYQVDYEYCARLYHNGYKIVKLNTAMLVHNIDDEDSRVEYINGIRYYINKYSPSSYYYIVRNNLYCAKIYKKINKQYVAETKRNLETMRKTLKYDSDIKRKRKAIFYAYVDFYLRRFGKCTRKL